MIDNRSKMSRRMFLVAAGAGGVASAAAIAYKAAPGEAPQQDSTNKRRKRYQVTAHIQNYYRTTQV